MLLATSLIFSFGETLLPNTNYSSPLSLLRFDWFKLNMNSVPPFQKLSAEKKNDRMVRMDELCLH